MHSIDYNIIGTTCSISIQEGDLLEQKGLKIVHCPRTFDTAPEIVPSHSVFGKFLHLCKSSDVDFDSQIEAWISLFSDRGKQSMGRKFRSTIFDFGELCPIMVGDEQFCISAFSNTNSIFSAEPIGLNDYFVYWNNLWSNLSAISVDREVVNVAVPGDRLVNVSTSGFLLPQKVAVIVNSFLQHIKNSGVCKHLNICLYGKDAKDFDYEGWKNTLLPFLDAQSHLPIQWTVKKVNAKPQSLNLVTRTSSERKEVDVESIFFADLREMIQNVGEAIGNDYIQFEGNKKTCIEIDADIATLDAIIDSVENDDSLKSFFIRKRGTTYDKNGMFQLIGAIHDCTKCFGPLNRRSLIKISLNAEENVPERWNNLGDNIDNIINYVGQKLADLKKNHITKYNNIRRLAPVEWRR